MAEPMRILHILGGLSLGGAESRIMGLYRHMDRERFQFDFLIHQEAPGFYEEEIKALGGRVYRVPRFRLYNLPAYRRALTAFFAERHGYLAAHGHMTSTAAIYLPIAKKSGIPVTIAHARSAGVDRGAKGIATRLLRLPLPWRCDHMFACSREAGIAVFGRKNTAAGKVRIVPNAVETKAFAYREEIRVQMRKKLSLTEKFVVGHVGRFHYAKNHEYLLGVFAALAKRRENAILLLLGEGPGMEEQRRRAAALGIADKVRFLGNQREVSDYYQAMDFFVFPSRFEGLPGTVVEAQCAGLPCLISETIAGEVKLTELVKFMSIEEAPETWADYIGKNALCERRDHAGEVAAAGYDVGGQALWYEAFYGGEDRG